MDGVTKFHRWVDWEWSDAHLEEVIDILKANSMHMLSIKLATPDEDMSRSTDLVMTVEGGNVAVRVRRQKYHSTFRDLTIRAWRSSGVKTELQKIIDGFGRWYLYAWADDNGIIDWLLVDLNKLRGSDLFDRPYIINKDNTTGFIAIKDSELKEAGCLIAERTAANLPDRFIDIAYALERDEAAPAWLRQAAHFVVEAAHQWMG